MNKKHTNRTSESQGKYSSPRPLPNMATPRRPEPSRRMGFGGVIFFLGVMGGFTWLFMLIFGLGPYATEKSTPTAVPVASSTLEWSAFPSETNTISPTPSRTATQTPTPTSTFTATPELLPFILKGEPEAMSSNYIRPQLGCEYLVIGGQVWDLKDVPISGLTLHLSGELGGYTVERFVLSGSAAAYGESGYEFVLENLVIDSENSLFIQLVDTNAIPLSHPYAIKTFNDCQKNLILVNFKQVR